MQTVQGFRYNSIIWRPWEIKCSVEVHVYVTEASVFMQSKSLIKSWPSVKEIFPQSLSSPCLSLGIRTERGEVLLSFVLWMN